MTKAKAKAKAKAKPKARSKAKATAKTKAKAAVDAKPTVETVDVSEICKHLNLGRDRVMQLAQEGIVKRHSRGKYLLVESSAAYIRYLQDRSSSTVVNEDLDLYEERARLTSIRADKEKLELEHLEETSMLVEDCRAGRIADAVKIRARLLSLPTRGAQRVVGLSNFKEIENALREEVYISLNSLVDDGDELAEKKPTD